MNEAPCLKLHQAGNEAADLPVGAAAVFQFANSYGAWGWQRDIRNGDLSSRLLKPLDPFHFYLCQNLGGKVLEVVIFTPVLVLATLLIPELRFALTPVRLVVFIVSLLAAFLLPPPPQAARRAAVAAPAPVVASIRRRENRC